MTSSRPSILWDEFVVGVMIGSVFGICLTAFVFSVVVA